MFASHISGRWNANSCREATMSARKPACSSPGSCAFARSPLTSNLRCHTERDSRKKLEDLLILARPSHSSHRGRSIGTNLNPGQGTVLSDCMQSEREAMSHIWRTCGCSFRKLACMLFLDRACSVACGQLGLSNAGSLKDSKHWQVTESHCVLYTFSRRIW